MCCAPGGKRWDADCSECHDPEKRRLWGCDEPSDEPLLEISPCPYRDGANQDCRHCSGSNRVPVHRCPNRTVTAREKQAVIAASQVELGVLPDAGGWMDQAYTFVTAYPLLAQEIERWREHARQEAEKRAKAKRGR